MLFHIREIGLWRGGPAPYLATIKLGYLGVSFFFVLSGFILVYVYTGHPLSKSRFWRARFARIYPAYLFSLLVTAPVLNFALPHMRALHVSPPLVFLSFPLLLESWFPSTLFFWNVVAWSLSVEAFFYLVFPFALRRLHPLASRGLALWIALSWLASLALSLTYVRLHPDGVLHASSQDLFLPWLNALKFNPLLRLPDFLLGMGAGALFLRTPPHPRNSLILAGALLLALGIALQRFIPYPVMHSGLLAPAFALLIFGFATQPAWTRPLGAKPLILLGEASYSLYLLHAFPLGIMVYVFHLDRSLHLVAVLLAYLAVMLLLSMGVFLALESPLRRRLRPRALPSATS